MRNALCAAIAALVWTTDAMAESGSERNTRGEMETAGRLQQMTLGYTYFNRPGADLKAHNADVETCIPEATSVTSMDEIFNETDYTGNLGPVGVQIKKKIDKSFSNTYRPGPVGAALENCMVVRGWRVVRLTEAEGQALAVSTQKDLATHLEPWIGADPPKGEIVRQWALHSLDKADPRFVERPPYTNDGSLSLKAATGETLQDVARREANPFHSANFPLKSLKPEQISSVGPDAAVLLIRIKGVGLGKGYGLTFTRESSDKVNLVSKVDQRPESAVFAVDDFFPKSAGKWFIMPVTPGRWRIDNLNSGMMAVNFCLGSPAFEVHAGEVIYLGTFDLSARDLRPDLDIAPATAYLATQPAVAKIRTPNYVNGSTGRCGDTGIYAFEIPGAPFQAGYRWGGALEAVKVSQTPN